MLKTSILFLIEKTISKSFATIKVFNIFEFFKTIKAVKVFKVLKVLKVFINNI